MSDSLFESRELRDGARSCVTPAIAVFIFAFAMGALAHQHDWSISYLIVFCLGIVGASIQAITIQMWGPPHENLPILAACFAVHFRYVLICASIKDLLTQFSFLEKLLIVHFTTDSNWVVNIARQRHLGKSSATFLLGGGFLIVGCLTLGNIFGFFSAELIGDIRDFGLDFAVPGVFLCLLFSLWRTPRSDAFSWMTALLVAVTCKVYISGGWYIVIGAFAGVIAKGIEQAVYRLRNKHEK